MSQKATRVSRGEVDGAIKSPGGERAVLKRASGAVAGVCGVAALPHNSDFNAIQLSRCEKLEFEGSEDLAVL